MVKLNKWIKIIAVLGALSIVLGALGAHALANVLDESSLQSFKTGVLYQFTHVFYLFIVLILHHLNIINSKKFTVISTLTLLGICLFSGSIYLLLWAKASNYLYLVKILGPITPIGGLSLITAWLVLFFNRKSN